MFQVKGNDNIVAWANQIHWEETYWEPPDQPSKQSGKEEDSNDVQILEHVIKNEKELTKINLLSHGPHGIVFGKNMCDKDTMLHPLHPRLPGP